MTNATTKPSPSPIPWGVALAAVSLVIIGGGVLVWTYQTDSPRDEQTIGPAPEPRAVMARIRELPLPPNVQHEAELHTVAYGVENGTPVVKIRVKADGDELIVDANTGRLLETRPFRPTAPPPMGKFAAPFAPMT